MGYLVHATDEFELFAFTTDEFELFAA